MPLSVGGAAVEGRRQTTARRNDVAITPGQSRDPIGGATAKQGERETEGYAAKGGRRGSWALEAAASQPVQIDLEDA